MIRKKLLIVYPEAFALGWRGATQRIIDITDGLSQFNYDIHMLSAKEWISKDQTEQEKLFKGKIIRTPFTGAYPSLFDKNNFMRRIYRSTWKTRNNKCYNENLSLGWSKKILKWIKSNWNSYKPDIILAICTSNINGMISGEILSKYFKCPYILEFQDPPSGYGHTYPTFSRLVDNCIINSSGIITVTNTYRNHLIDKYNINPNTVITIYLSFKNHHNNIILDNNKIVFLHAGSLSGGINRNVNCFIYALNIINLRYPKIINKILLRLIGDGYGINEAKNLVESYNLSNNLDILPEMDSNKLNEYLYKAHVLLVIKHSSSNYNMQIPGKLFYYLGYNKPILGLMNINTEAADIIKKSSLGLVVDNFDINRLVKSILFLYKNRNKLNLIFKPNKEYINQFHFNNMAQLLNNFLEIHM